MDTRKRILVVDDDSTARLLLREILEPAGFDILEAQDGLQALVLIEERGGVDLLITDRAMPGMDGMALLKTLRDKKRLIPAIMVSAFGEEGLWSEALSYGAADYLLKPFQHDEVLRLVKKGLIKEGKKK